MIHIRGDRTGGIYMADIFELLMIVCFGVSWPLNIHKAWKARTAKGSSVQFYFLILIGYLFGIASKVIKLHRGIFTPGYVWFFYILNSVIVAAGILVWFRNRRLDRMGMAGR